VDLGRRRTPALSGAAATLAVLAACGGAAPANAATVSVEGTVLRVAAGAAEPNAIVVSDGAPGSFTVTDAGAPPAAGPGCLPAGVGVTCSAPPGATVEVSAGDLGDSVAVVARVAAFVDGGAGDDAIDVRGGLADSVWCGGGRDSVTAEPLDFLDLGCERVDYGLAGSVGRSASRTGGGGLVPVPGQTWARVDRRILPGVLYLIRRYHVRIDEGYGTVGHEPFGEHPLGLAVDIEPGAGGTWADVSRLARWAEPRQNRPRFPFRWVGWNGDYNHGHPSVCKPRLGCAPHLHLSWSHTSTRPRHVARTVWVFEVR